MNRCLLLVAVILLLPTFARADLAVPTPGRLEQERRRIEADRKAMFDANNPALRAPAPALPASQAIQQEIRRLDAERKALFDPANPDTARSGGAFPEVEVPPVSRIDVQALARRYEQVAQARRTDDLMVFVSFTMPAPSLRRIVAQAARVGGTVVLNGFKDNSWRATALAIQELGEQAGNVVVNPDAFTKYRIRAVPVTVLALPEAVDHLDADGCALPDTYAAVAGDVSLDHALDDIARREPRFAELALRHARQIRGGR